GFAGRQERRPHGRRTAKAGTTQSTTASGPLPPSLRDSLRSTTAFGPFKRKRPTGRLRTGEGASLRGYLIHTATTLDSSVNGLSLMRMRHALPLRVGVSIPQSQFDDFRILV